VRYQTVVAKSAGVQYPELKGKVVREVRYANDNEFNGVTIEFEDNTQVSFRFKASIDLIVHPELATLKGGDLMNFRKLRTSPVRRRIRVK
jgi:uncharacterized protein YkuJ